MAPEVPFPRPIRWARLRADEAERVIRERATDTGNVVILEHAFDRIDLRAIVAEDVYRILRNGYVEGPPTRDGDEWKVVVVKRMPGTREAGVVTVFTREDKHLIVVTVEWMDLLR